jgi:transcriptional regulator with GAF, ATPase, and Fis domain/response regulator of citrate/malate metabolism
MALRPPDPTTPATLLIVEDEFIIANDLRLILEKAGYLVTGIAESADRAMELVLAQPPDIVLLDIFLSGEQTGIELAHWLAARHIPFVYLSANLTDTVLEAAKVTQPFGFLNKPFREKDVLTTLEIARYRHAHSAEATLRQQQEIQMAVNNAIITIQNRDQLCLAIAAEINKLVPFCLLQLRIDLPEEASSYQVMLRTNAAGYFERVHLCAVLGGLIPEVLLDELSQEPLDPLGELQGVFVGTAFGQLCARYRTAQALRDALGYQSMALFPVALNRRSVTTIHLASLHANGFTAKDFEAINLIIPQIALALNNLLAYEEIEARRQLLRTELALVSTFQHGQTLVDIVAPLAGALNELLAIDVLGIVPLDEQAKAPPADAVVQKKPGGRFEALPTRPQPLTASDWPPLLVALRPVLTHPTLLVGEPADQASPRNLMATFYGDKLGLQSFLQVPLVVNERVLAVLLLGSKHAYAFTQKELQTVQHLSRPVGLALENLLAFERIKLLSEQLEQEKTYLTEEIKNSHNFEEIIGTSPALHAVFRGVGQVAPTDYTVLIMGETGTGKELIARAIHNRSRRCDRTMVKVNCAALPPQLIESELFGHERGSFTGATDKRLGKFELAHGSTIFLDEIGELPLELQAKLLRALQEKEIERLGGKGPIVVDVRIIAATNRNLQQEVAAGRFRSDLYYRLNVFPLLVPPLRERPEDILPLTLHFLHKASKKLGKPLTGLAHAALPQLQQYPWPGNIRELEHVVERAAILAQSATVDLAEPLTLTPPSLPASSLFLTAAGMPLKDILRERIMAALVQSNYRIRGRGGAAELLGLKPTTLEARIKKLRIDVVKQLSTPA